MKKQILKRFTMLMLIVGLALATAAVSANAQSQRVIANIPFEFVVGDKTLPGGEYSLRSASAASDALMVQGADNGKSAVRLSYPAKEKDKTHARLVFHRYGQSYFLAEVWDGQNTGRQIVKSRQERAIERELASIPLASIPTRSEPARNTCETIEVVAVLR
ncbi:MAG: hypothetical protein M3R52_05380 [Acidobacteriota bacterium]|nr:hypothetical protein [Acidobacteriota bacterium]